MGDIQWTSLSHLLLAGTPPWVAVPDSSCTFTVPLCLPHSSAQPHCARSLNYHDGRCAVGRESKQQGEERSACAPGMKGLAMEDASSMGFEIQRLKRSVRTAQLLTLLLGLLVLVMLIALAAVGASQAKKINNLKNVDDDVFFGVHSSLRDRAGATYAGSLFRGSGFWATRAVLPGDHLT